MNSESHADALHAEEPQATNSPVRRPWVEPHLQCESGMRISGTSGSHTKAGYPTEALASTTVLVYGPHS